MFEVSVDTGNENWYTLFKFSSLNDCENFIKLYDPDGNVAIKILNKESREEIVSYANSLIKGF